MAAEYQIIRDTEFTLGTDQDETFSFTLPQQLIRTGARKPVLSFLVRPVGVIGDMRFKVDLNDDPEVDATMQGSHKRGFWEVINNNIAKVGTNTIHFRVLSGIGNVTFSDVVVWYQRP